MDDIRALRWTSPRARGWWCALGVLASLAALLLSAAAFVEPLSHRLSDDERAHVAKASAGVRAFIADHGRLPDDGEFADWVRRTDARDGTRFDGLGFGIAPRCARRSPRFCLGFWTGEAWVTFRSWQADADTAEIDGHLDTVIVEAGACVVLGAIAALAFRTARRS